MLVVRAPLRGLVIPMSAVPDPVFAEELVGPGVAIRPMLTDNVVACAPITGKVLKLFPHAFAITNDDGAALVHLGLDTIKLHGEGFTLEVEQGDLVFAGDPIVAWSPRRVQESGYDPVVPVIALDAKPGWLTHLVEPDSLVIAEEPLFEVRRTD